ncbi:MAG: hypothetical protein DWQ01_18695 [Planctomycetota bacterium]|nr:MAG: hypothetical protein DWQ01_18695 [Planctomycetota bacterium]
MKTIPKSLAVCAGFAVLHSVSPAQHYSRELVVVDQSVVTIEQLAIASDQELTALLYREGGSSNQVLAVTADGRALGSEFSAPALVSAATSAARDIQNDSIHVLEDRAYALWADDEAGAASTRLWFNRHQNGAWGTATALPDGGLLTGLDLKYWATAIGAGINGNTTVAALACYTSGGSDQLYLHVSVDGGNNFLTPQAVSDLGSSPGLIDGVAVELEGISLQCAWIDDRAGSGDVYHRHAIVDFLGGVTWQRNDLKLSSGAGSDALGSLELAVNGEASWSGADAKYVGAAWLQDDGDGTNTLRVAASHTHGADFLPEDVVAHTGDPGADVEAFDFEISGDTFHVAWQDSTLGTRQVFRVSSEEGTSWDGITGSEFVKVSGQSDPGAEGFSPGITRSTKTPDATCTFWIEHSSGGLLNVVTAFADQSLGGAFHDEYSPIGPGSKVPEASFGPAAGAYNFLYNNFALAWLEGDGAGVKDLIVSGFRPQAVEVEDFTPSENDFHFFVEHLPFQDLYGFVLVSSAASTGPNFLLPDGRNTGLVRDAVTDFGLANLGQFIGPNLPAFEGAETPLIPTSSVPPGLTLRFVGVSVGPFGEPHVLTDVFEATFQ